MTYLLDVNLLIALIDTMHVNHEVAHRWFSAIRDAAWATCPITENGFIRIVGSARYNNVQGSPSIVATALAGLCAAPGHVFWTDNISLLDRRYVDREKLATPGQVTDSYLLALAVAHGGRLATLDRRLSVAAVTGGREALDIL